MTALTQQQIADMNDARERLVNNLQGIWKSLDEHGLILPGNARESLTAQTEKLLQLTGAFIDRIEADRHSYTAPLDGIRSALAVIRKTMSTQTSVSPSM